jgi:arylsulfatase A-like enzyme
MHGEIMRQRPNILIISVDDMNDWVGCLNGYPGVSTPNIDALANRGVLFRNAHCPSPLCNPSRTAILTGQAPSTSGIYNNQHWWRPNRPDLVSLPMHMKANGYTTAGAGKVFHHMPGFNPPDQWDEYCTMVFDDPWDRKNYPWLNTEPKPSWHPANGLSPFYHEHDWGPMEKPDEEWGDIQAIEWAKGFLQRPQDRPFFLALGTFRPHIPWYAPLRFFDRYPLRTVHTPAVFDSDLEGIPKSGLRMAEFSRNEFEKMVAGDQWEAAVQAYLACISFADEMIGTVIGALDSSNYADNTTIIFYSDNGYHLGEKKHFTKCTLWERSTHVPFIVVPPRSENSANETVSWRPFATDEPTSLQDIYPTVLDICGLEAPEPGIDGASVLPSITDPLRTHNRGVVTTYLRGNHAVRLHDWRYIRYADGGEELYHTSEDPDERNNLIADAGYATMIDELQNLLPVDDAKEVRSKSEFSFDYDSYTWQPA